MPKSLDNHTGVYLKQHGFGGNADKITRDAISAVNLDYSVLKKYPHELSGGMKQRIV